jgi:hypothetical protein
MTAAPPVYSNEGAFMIFGRYLLNILLSAAAASLAFAGVPQDAQSPKQDVKDAGHATKNAAKDTGRATKNSAARAGHATKRTSKRAAHKTARKTRQGAQNVEDKTQPH